MRYLSVCSGIEAATSAWHHMGWQPAAFSEIEPFPSAVLAHHYPGVPNVGDMTKFKEWQIGAIDLLVGGTPCQAFSVAGLRGGLSDARGNLSLTFCEIADHFDPQWILWENVPGVLSSKDNAFGCFLAGLSGAGEPLVSERGWDSAGLVAGPKRTVAWRVLDAQFNGVAQRRRRVFVLAVRGAGNWASARALFPLGEGVFWDSAPSREAGQRVAPTIAGCANGGGANGPGRDVDSCESLQVQWWDGGDVAATLTTKSDDQRMPDKANAQLVMQPVAFTQNQRDEVRTLEVAGALAAEPGMKQQTYLRQAMQVRRLTPRECERLQGFPDDHTLIPWRGKPATECPDGPRYKALGNSMAVPVMRWIGERVRLVSTHYI